MIHGFLLFKLRDVVISDRRLIVAGRSSFVPADPESMVVAVRHFKHVAAVTSVSCSLPPAEREGPASEDAVSSSDVGHCDQISSQRPRAKARDRCQFSLSIRHSSSTDFRRLGYLDVKVHSRPRPLLFSAGPIDSKELIVRKAGRVMTKCGRSFDKFLQHWRIL
jgi:hypothetical protein